MSVDEGSPVDELRVEGEGPAAGGREEVQQEGGRELGGEGTGCSGQEAPARELQRLAGEKLRVLQTQVGREERKWQCSEDIVEELVHVKPYFFQKNEL